MLTQEKIIQLSKGNLVMPFTKIGAFLDEFPWIRKHVKNKINQVYVQKVEPKFLEYRLERCDWGFLIPEYVYEEIFFLDKNGNLVNVKGKKQVKKWWFFGPNIEKKVKISGFGSGRNLPVKSVISKVWKKAEEVRYFLSYFSYTKAVIIYKFPKNISLEEWILDEIASERERFQAEVAAIG